LSAALPAAVGFAGASLSTGVKPTRIRTERPLRILTEVLPALRNATDKEIYEAMLTGPGTMPVFSNNQLTEKEKQDIIAYVQGVKAEPDPGGAGLGRSGAVAEGLVGFLGGIVVLAGVAMWIGARAKRAG